MTSGRQCGFGGAVDLGLNAGSAFCCVTLSMGLNLSDSQFPHQHNGDCCENW